MKGKFVEKRYFCDGKLHRDRDKPAVILRNVVKYYKHGRLHRNGDKPAVISNREIIYYKQGKRHRDGNKPAVITSTKNNISKEFYVNGKMHRDIGPANIRVYGDKMEWIGLEWKKDGKTHRLDGPAYIGTTVENGVLIRKTFYYINGYMIGREGQWRYKCTSCKLELCDYCKCKSCLVRVTCTTTCKERELDLIGVINSKVLKRTVKQ